MMETGFEQYWYEGRSRVTLPRMVALSVCLHALVIAALFEWNHWSLKDDSIKVFHVEFIKDAPVTMEPVVQKPPEPEKKPAPVTPEEKKPEPPKPVEKKPDPPKPKEEKKPDPPKPKEEKKPEPKPKPAPKPDPKKKPPDLKPIDPPELKPSDPPELTPSEPPKEMISKAKSTPTRSSLTTVEMPVELMSWGALVQRKVELAWVIPGGVQISSEEAVAEIAFTVDKDGNLLDEPVVVKEASDPAVGESGVRAVKLAPPFPPLPQGYPKSEQRVVCAFSLLQ